MKIYLFILLTKKLIGAEKGVVAFGLLGVERHGLGLTRIAQRPGAAHASMHVLLVVTSTPPPRASAL